MNNNDTKDQDVQKPQQNGEKSHDSETASKSHLNKVLAERQSILEYPKLLRGGCNKETAGFLKVHKKLEVDKNSSSTKETNGILEHGPWIEYLEQNICSWNFDMIKLRDLTNGKHVLEYGQAISKKFKVLDTLQCDTETLRSFLNDVEDFYLPNAYHNSIHGADVANSTGYFVNSQPFGKHFNNLEISCLIISALVHDLGHPGLNNTFLIATKSQEASTYNEVSVLENYHVTTFFKILEKPASNILKNLSENDYKYFKRAATQIILDTDLGKHFQIVSKFKDMAENLNMKEEDDRMMSMSICLKCADVAHGGKELDLHKRWSRRILEEFFWQGDQEIELGLPLSPLCDRKCNVAKSQQGFLNFICKPLFDLFDKAFFDENMRKTVSKQIEDNIKYWGDEMAKEEKGEKSLYMDETAQILDDIKTEAAQL